MEQEQKSNHLNTGRLGEDLAHDYLIEKGYHILARNWSLGRNELDIIARDGDELVVVEVKSRTEPVLDHPIMAVDKKKQRHVISAAHAYIRFTRTYLPVRFDVIWVQLINGKAKKISHYQDAFIPCL